MERIYAFLLAEILNFQGSTHFIGVGSLSNLLENYRVGDIWQFNSFAYYVRDKAILGEEIYSGIIS